MESGATTRFWRARIPPRAWRESRLNKLALQKELGLPEAADVPLFGTISRLAEQKGVDIQLGALEEMLSTDMQFVLLGSGSPAYERGYYELARRFPSKVAARVGYDEGLAHRIEAGCDFYLMPSRFEPSGLNQMYSLRYGTIPIVRATGGLDDSVIDFTETPRAPTESSFTNIRRGRWPRPFARRWRFTKSRICCGDSGRTP